jgi:hypothetical protein
MNNEMILEVQIAKLYEMREYLSDFSHMMYDHMRELHDELSLNKAQGFPTEIADRYEQRHYAPARTTIEQMSQRIYTLHYNYIDGVIEDLERARNR